MIKKAPTPAQMIAMTLHQLIGFVISFPEEPETAQRDFREISPHFTFAPARIYEALHTGVTVHMLDAGWLRQRVCAWALAVGGRVVDLRSHGAPVPYGVRLQHAVARHLVFRPVLDKILPAGSISCHGGAEIAAAIVVGNSCRPMCRLFLLPAGGHRGNSQLRPTKRERNGSR